MYQHVRAIDASLKKLVDASKNSENQKSVHEYEAGAFTTELGNLINAVTGQIRYCHFDPKPIQGGDLTVGYSITISAGKVIFSTKLLTHYSPRRSWVEGTTWDGIQKDLFPLTDNLTKEMVGEVANFLVEQLDRTSRYLLATASAPDQPAP